MSLGIPGILCGLCQLVIPAATVDCDIKLFYGDSVRLKRIASIELCPRCLRGEPVRHKKLAIVVARIRERHDHTNPLTRV